VSRAFLYVRLRYLLALAALSVYQFLFTRWVRLWLSWHYQRIEVVALVAGALCLLAYVLVMGWLCFSVWPYGR
jgi:hypothetical protein